MKSEILILASLAEEPRHGYDLRQHVGRLSGGSLRLNNNQLYPVLKRFESAGLVSGSQEAQSGRPDRRIFRITELGVNHLRGLLEDFPECEVADERAFLVRVRFFHLIQPHQRVSILVRRRDYLLERQSVIAQRLQTSDAAPAPESARAVLSYVGERIQLELAWVQRWLEQEVQS